MTDLDKSMARQWAVFETTPETEQYMTFGQDQEAFDAQESPGKLVWTANLEGTCPRDVFAQLETDYPGRHFVVVPLGVFGPSDWMREAGAMLQKIDA